MFDFRWKVLERNIWMYGRTNTFWSIDMFIPELLIFRNLDRNLLDVLVPGCFVFLSSLFQFLCWVWATRKIRYLAYLTLLQRIWPLYWIFVSALCTVQQNKSCQFYLKLFLCTLSLNHNAETNGLLSGK